MKDVHKRIKEIFTESEKKYFKIGVVGYSDKKFDIKKAKKFIKEGFDELEKKHKNIEIVSGLTNLGIPKLAYEEAVNRGYRTVGIACKKSKDFECFNCDEEIIIGDEWGDESDKFINYIDVLLRIGGGKQSKKETKMVKDMGKKVVEFELEEITNKEK